MAYPPQQGPYGPQAQQQYGGYPQQPGPYGAPPPKNKAPLIATLLFVVAVLAGLGITGFVAPGFFLSDDDGKSGGSASDAAGGDSQGAGEGDPDLRQFAADLVAAANEQDKSALEEFPCDDAGPGVSQAINEIDDTDGAELDGIKELAADKYVIVVDITFQGKQAPFAATATKAGDSWCWQDFAPGTGGSPSGSDSGDDSDGPASGPGAPSGDSGDSGDSPGGEDGEALVEEFIAAVNAKDSAKANSMYCDDAPSNSLVDHVIKKDPKLAVDSIDASKYFLQVTLSGTLGGEPLNLGKVSVKLTGSGAPCVFTFGAG